VNASSPVVAPGRVAASGPPTAPGRVAAIDCGTNSVRLLIAESDAGKLRDLTRTMRIVRLGEGVDRTGRLATAALDRTATALTEYRALIDAADVASVRMVATSAVRDAANRDDFDAMVERILGLRAEVVTGIEEAELSFTGACAGLADADADADAGTGAVVVADIGGGSTELIRGSAQSGRVDGAVSLDVGSVRLTERHVRSDPPAPAELAAIAADVRRALDSAGTVGVQPGDRLVGVAGTVTTVAAVALRLPRYDSSHIHASTLSRGDIDRAVQEIVSMNRSQREAQAVIHPGRVDVIAAGAVILATVMAHLEADTVTVSEHDILDGIALGLQA
jgi:exopolyphosphatase / guanosine-5'-triphosphate,3'-diphosphate pyrophosphatase